MCRSADAPFPAVGYAIVVATRTRVGGGFSSYSCPAREGEQHVTGERT
jgi:hypothetical protein